MTYILLPSHNGETPRVIVSQARCLDGKTTVVAIQHAIAEIGRKVMLNRRRPAKHQAAGKVFGVGTIGAHGVSAMGGHDTLKTVPMPGLVSETEVSPPSLCRTGSRGIQSVEIFYSPSIGKGY